MAIGNSLNPDCTVRACRMPRLFISILAQRLHPVVVASADCMSSISAFMSITGGHVTNQNEHLARLESRWTSMSRAWCHTGRASREHDITCAASVITAAITQVAANKLKIKIDAKCDLGSSHCYHAISTWQSATL